MTPRSTQVVPSTDGVRLALHHLGGDGPVVLVCHATGFHGRAYEPLADPLSAEYSVWALDFRGHGASTAPVSGDFTWDGMAADVLAVVDAIGVDGVLGVGHSLGGAALLLAELARPGVLRAGFLFEPIVFPRETILARTENPMSAAARRRRDEFPSREAALARDAGRPPLDALRADALAAYVEHGFVDANGDGVRLACTPEHEARTFEAEDNMTLDRLVGIDSPIVVALGESSDHLGPADLAPAIADRLPGGRLHRYDGLGHFGPLEDPDRVAGDIALEFRAPQSLD